MKNPDGPHQWRPDEALWLVGSNVSWQSLDRCGRWPLPGYSRIRRHFVIAWYSREVEGIPSSTWFLRRFRIGLCLRTYFVLAGGFCFTYQFGFSTSRSSSRNYLTGLIWINRLNELITMQIWSDTTLEESFAMMEQATVTPETLAAVQAVQLELTGENAASLALRRPFDPVAHDLDATFRLTRFADLKGWGCKVPQDVLLKLLEGLQDDGSIQEHEQSQYLHFPYTKIGMLFFFSSSFWLVGVLEHIRGRKSITLIFRYWYGCICHPTSPWGTFFSSDNRLFLSFGWWSLYARWVLYQT